MRDERTDTSLEKMREELYRRDISGITASSFKMKMKDSSYRKDWENEYDNTMTQKSSKKNFSLFEKIFAVSFLFFMAAIAGAAFLFFAGGNVVSSENIEVKVFGPNAVSAGDELSLQIAITNNNNTNIEFSDLLIEYPEGARRVENEKEKFPRERMSLGMIGSGETVNHIARAALFGEEGEEKKIHITLEYRVEGSNAIFTKEAEYDVVISSSSINLSVQTLEEVSANQELTIEVSVRSNSDMPMENLLLTVSYPFGFDEPQSEPSPSYGNNIWKVGSLKSGEEKKIRITGILRGVENEEKIFRVEVGRQDESQERNIAVVYSSLFRKVAIKKPFLEAVLALNNNTSEQYVAGSNETIHGVLQWINNLPSRVADMVIEIKIEGDALDKPSVSVEGGNYNSSSNTILWDKRTMKNFALVETGQKGILNFSFKPKSLLSPDASSLRNPEIKISISISGARVSDDGAMEGIKESVQRKISVNSLLQIVPRAVYYAGPFVNSGSIPPKAEQKTTYTIMLSAINSTNEMSNVKVRATLPSYVSFTGEVSPEDAAISFDNMTGEVVWNIGSMEPGEGVSLKARESAFQISFLPSVSHIGSVPDLVYNIEISGKDNFTGSDVTYRKGNLNTNLSTDPQFESTNAQVIQ